MTTADLPAPAKRPERPLRADARRNYARLLAAANAAFAEHGPDASLDDIAQRASVGIGTLYRHFPTRQALLEAVYRDQIDSLRAEAEALRDAPSPQEALAAWLRSLLAHNLTQRGLKEALMNGEASALVAESKAQLRAAGAELLARAQQAGAVRADLDVNDLLRLVYGIALADERSPAGSPKLANRCLLVMLDGLATLERATE